MGRDFLQDPFELNPVCTRDVCAGLRRAVAGAFCARPPRDGEVGSFGVGRGSTVGLRDSRGSRQ
eukprot:13248775-Alexandrium_andersonii.AAC.1